MIEACCALKGTHDFAAFQGSPRGSDDKQRRLRQKQKLLANNEAATVATTCSLVDVSIRSLTHPLNDLPVRDVSSAPAANIMRHPSSAHFSHLRSPLQTYVISVTGNRFLYKMMRFIIGAIVSVGTQQLAVNDIQQALEHGTWSFDPENRTQVEVGEKTQSTAREGSSLQGEMQPMRSSMNHMESGRRKEFRCAPPHGLTLMDVQFDKNVSEIDWQPLRF